MDKRKLKERRLAHEREIPHVRMQSGGKLLRCRKLCLVTERSHVAGRHRKGELDNQLSIILGTGRIRWYQIYQSLAII